MSYSQTIALKTLNSSPLGLVVQAIGVGQLAITALAAWKKRPNIHPPPLLMTKTIAYVVEPTPTTLSPVASTFFTILAIALGCLAVSTIVVFVKLAKCENLLQTLLSLSSSSSSTSSSSSLSTSSTTSTSSSGSTPPFSPCFYLRSGPKRKSLRLRPLRKDSPPPGPPFPDPDDEPFTEVDDDDSRISFLWLWLFILSLLLFIGVKLYRRFSAKTKKHIAPSANVIGDWTNSTVSFDHQGHGDMCLIQPHQLDAACVDPRSPGQFSAIDRVYKPVRSPFFDGPSHVNMCVSQPFRLATSGLYLLASKRPIKLSQTERPGLDLVQTCGLVDIPPAECLVSEDIGICNSTMPVKYSPAIRIKEPEPSMFWAARKVAVDVALSALSVTSGLGNGLLLWFFFELVTVSFYECFAD